MNFNEVIVVDEDDKVLGYMEKMEAHQKGVLHRAISVFIVNSKNEWLLQQRAAHKYHSGLLWSNTTCTHPIKGESTIDAAKRRLFEEVGLEAALRKMFDFKYTAQLDNDLVENELDHVYIGYSDELPRINPDEVASYRYVNSESLAIEIENNPDSFTEWFKLLFPIVNNELKK